MFKKNNMVAVLCVDAIKNGVPRGRFYYGDLSCERAFYSLDQFMLVTDAVMDGDETAGDPVVRENGAIWHAGKLATFKLNILFRQNASWQGSVLWLETRHEEKFRSALELLSIVHQALVPAQKQRLRPSSLKIAK